MPADKSAWTQTELGDVDPIEVLVPPGPDLAPEVVIPPTVHHHNHGVLVEQALNARLSFQPPYRCFHQIMMIMSEALTEPMDTVTLRHEVVVRIVFYTDGRLSVDQANWYCDQCPRFEVEELHRTYPTMRLYEGVNTYWPIRMLTRVV